MSIATLKLSPNTAGVVMQLYIQYNTEDCRCNWNKHVVIVSL